MDLSSDQLSIDTPELVAIEMPLAGIGSRFIALLLDYLICGAGLLFMLLVFAVILPGILRILKNLRAMGDGLRHHPRFSASVGLLHAL